MLADYLAIGGVEIINSWRAKAYTGTAGDCGVVQSSCLRCDDAGGVWLNNGEPYEGVQSDPAPWYDPALPESLGVGGVSGVEIVGVDTVPSRQGSTRSVQARDIEFTVLLDLVDDCAYSYMLGWLAAALGEPVCATSSGSQCSGQQACMVACCPNVGDDGEAVTDPLRLIFDVVTVDGPTVEEKKYHLGGRIVATVTFTLRTMNLGVYRNPVPDQVIEVAPYNGDDAIIDLPAVYEACEDPPDCAVDPDCVPDPLAPLPEPPVDECYPSEPFAAKRTVVTIPGGAVSQNLDMLPVVTVTAGSAPVRNFTVRFYLNPFGVDCDTIGDLNPCRACADLTVPYIPPDGTLTIDGRVDRAWTTCRSDEGLSTHVPNVYGPAGGVSQTPIIACGPGLCIEIITEAAVPIDALVRVELHTRQLAG